MYLTKYILNHYMYLIKTASVVLWFRLECPQTKDNKIGIF